MNEPEQSPLPWKGRGRLLPFRLRLAGDDGHSTHERLLSGRFRLGYGDECDVQLPGGGGPRVLFEVENARGPLLIARALPPEEFANYVDVKVDGKPLEQLQQTLNPGSRVDVVDKATKQHYQMVVDWPDPHPWLSARNLTMAMVTLCILGIAVGGYFYKALTGVQDDVERTSDRMVLAESKFEFTANELLESVRQMGSSDAELARAVRELRRLQAASSRAMHEEFTQRISLIEVEARKEAEQREKTAGNAQRRLVELRAEFEQRMVSAYEHLEEVERSMLGVMAQRFEARGPSGTTLKNVLAASQASVLFVRTQFRVKFGALNEPKELESLGSGFLVGADGLAVTAQHVMYPWRYDKELLVLINLGLAEVVPGSMRWSVWPIGRTVLDNPEDPSSYHEADAFRSEGANPTLSIILAPEPKLSGSFVSSPVGIVQLPVPLPGRTDVVVFKLESAEEEMAFLKVSASQQSVAPLDALLAVGYPFSRLAEGQAWPQAVRGFVRRVGDELIEVDAAVHPGLSGGPLIDAKGEVLGLLSATVGSDVYAVAVRARDLHAVIVAAREKILKRTGTH